MGESLAEPTAKRDRPRRRFAGLKDHFTEHWIEWLIGAAVVVGGYFVVDARIHFTDVDRSIKDTQADVMVLKQSMTSVQSAVQGNLITEQETRVRMEQTQTLVQMLVGDRLQQGGNQSTRSVSPVPKDLRDAKVPSPSSQPQNSASP
jgi:hypothetical protein